MSTTAPTKYPRPWLLQNYNIDLDLYTIPMLQAVASPQYCRPWHLGITIACGSYMPYRQPMEQIDSSLRAPHTVTVFGKAYGKWGSHWAHENSCVFFQMDRKGMKSSFRQRVILHRTLNGCAPLADFTLSVRSTGFFSYDIKTGDCSSSLP